MHTSYQDLALILAWPDTTIRGDEKWMMFFKKIGIVKNLNFKVGHTGIILIDSHTKELLYYDFGRYISPRGLGRARSKESDPRLSMKTRAVFDQNGEIQNLQEIALEIKSMDQATQGFGDLFFSEARDISFQKAKLYADSLVEEGSTPYGAVAKGNNNCSRFITRLLMKSSKRYHFFHGINWPETLKASPLSNVVNVKPDRLIYVFDHQNKLSIKKMNRWQSLCFLIKQLGDNLSNTRSHQFPDDRIIGSMNQKTKPKNLPNNIQWLGGVGEGAWFHLHLTELRGVLEISRFTEKGELEYRRLFQSSERLPEHHPNDVKIAYDSHLMHSHIEIKGRTFKLLPYLEIPLHETNIFQETKKSEKILQVG